MRWKYESNRSRLSVSSSFFAVRVSAWSALRVLDVLTARVAIVTNSADAIAPAVTSASLLRRANF
jgi:hypothetical protein